MYQKLTKQNIVIYTKYHPCRVNNKRTKYNYDRRPQYKISMHEKLQIQSSSRPLCKGREAIEISLSTVTTPDHNSKLRIFFGRVEGGRGDGEEVGRGVRCGESRRAAAEKPAVGSVRIQKEPHDRKEGKKRKKKKITII